MGQALRHNAIPSDGRRHWNVYPSDIITILNGYMFFDVFTAMFVFDYPAIILAQILHFNDLYHLSMA